MVHAVPGGHVRIHGPLPQAMLKSEVHVVSRLPLEAMWMSDALATARGQMLQKAILVSEVWVPVSGHVDPSGHVGVHNPVAAQAMLMSAACVTTEGHGVPGRCCCLKLC